MNKNKKIYLDLKNAEKQEEHAKPCHFWAKTGDPLDGDGLKQKMDGKDVNPLVLHLRMGYSNYMFSIGFYREKWIYVHKESTKERHGYCTLGEAFNRLDFSSAIQDIRRFNYVVKLIAKSQLTSLSGAAQKNYFNILDKIVQKVMEDQYNPRLIKDLLQDLSSTLCILIRGVGKSVLQVNNGLTLSDLPLHMLNNILYRFSDGWDIITLGQVTPTLYMLSEDRQLWKKLCQYHFAEKQTLVSISFPKLAKERTKQNIGIVAEEESAKTKDTGHPCTASDPNTCLMPVLAVAIVMVKHNCRFQKKTRALKMPVKIVNYHY
ncbi:hypothetical protein IHE44_0009669 [Lamprotornis superbus]|uniref:F-box only protein 25 n=1 Tax=Lamprotornis superbus TaxID=245042 RepID=A0A835TZG3_9PASS|nr:hypothetical protein IHE44_0009669 [Lamprotornis superbus]